MKKTLLTLVRTAAIAVATMSSISSYAGVFDVEGRGLNQKVVSKNEKNVISKCHQIKIRTSRNFHFGDGMLWVDGFDPDCGVKIYDNPATDIYISENQIKFSMKKQFIVVKYNGKKLVRQFEADTYNKVYEIVGSDREGISFKDVVEADYYPLTHPAIEFWKYSRLDHHYGYAEHMGNENMAGDNPIFLKILKQWAKKFKKAKIHYE